MTLYGTLDFHKKLVGEKGIGFDKWDMSKKKDFTENKPKEDKCQALVSRMKGDKCTRVSDDTSFSRFSIS